VTSMAQTGLTQSIRWSLGGRDGSLKCQTGSVRGALAGWFGKFFKIFGGFKSRLGGSRGLLGESTWLAAPADSRTAFSASFS
jgi:hypothetical protein